MEEVVLGDDLETVKDNEFEVWDPHTKNQSLGIPEDRVSLTPLKDFLLNNVFPQNSRNNHDIFLRKLFTLNVEPLLTKKHDLALVSIRVVKVLFQKVQLDPLLGIHLKH